MDFNNVGTKIDDIEVRISYKIIELFSAGLYSSPNKAFEELICNSYDAFADTVSVYVPSDLSVTGTYIWVCDNGEGLNPTELKDLWKIGESAKRANTDRDKRRLQIGQFGIGKLSTYILARKLTYISKKNNRFILATMDYDLIHANRESLTIDEREISEADARELLQQYININGINMVSFSMFGPESAESWTMSILTDLRTKAAEITVGRLKWILRTALPLSPGFNLYFNKEKIESSKIDNPIMKEWIIGKDDSTADSLDFAEGRKEGEHYYVDFEYLKDVNGVITLYEDSLLEGKSAALGRSHGIFLIIRGRLINLDDPLLGMEAFSHGAFNRTRIVINADNLDQNLTSTREAVKESRPFAQLKEYIKKKFNNEVRKYYFEQEQKLATEKSVSYRLAQTSYATSKGPVYNFIKRYYLNEVANPLLIFKPSNVEEKDLLSAYEKDEETGAQVIEKIDWAPLDTGSPIAKLNIVNKTLTINAVHPYIANYSDAYKNTLPLESIAITEVLTEAHLYELGIDEGTINAIMRKRDNTLRQLALSDREGIPAVALLLSDSLANPMGLEDAVYRAFLALGFEASKIGGNGKPDGKAEAILGYGSDEQSRNYSLTYDAKSTSKDKIAANTAKLSGLKRHQVDYGATYAVEVAIGYQGEYDPESAISKEARQQKITLIKAIDLVKLLFFAAPKQLGLGKLRELFETCYAPLDVKKWIDNIESEKEVVGPYYEIVEIVYELQKNDNEPPTTSVVRLKLNERLKTQFSTSHVTAFIETLKGMVPGYVFLEETRVGVQASPEVIKTVIGKIINTNIPVSMQTLYKSIFKIGD
ncbi:MAG TPA: ATP-binding protein [Selenomonadales bacterium]|nr:ATP-binding protein [Selenomonadales bacterium]